MNLGTIFKEFKWSVAFVLTLVILQSTGFLLFPLLIGYAIDDLIDGSIAGLINLGILGGVELIVGTGRRFYDTRVYARIYKKLASKIINEDKKSSESVLSARVHMFEEMIWFLEKSLPELITGMVILLGTMVILYSFSMPIFLGCLAALSLIILVFGITSSKTMRYNRNYNDMMEDQVAVIKNRDPIRVQNYVRNLMRWTVKLSDLETINFSVTWIGMIALLIYSVHDSITSGEIHYGAVTTVVMYVFSFIENAEYMPQYYQQWIRLKEISNRLSK